MAGLRHDRLVARMAGMVGAAVLVGALTGWPVAAVLAGAAVFALPSLLRGGRDRARRVARTEAIAGWAEMLRDTLAAAAGLEQAIVATAEVSPAPIRSEVTDLAARPGDASAWSRPCVALPPTSPTPPAIWWWPP